MLLCFLVIATAVTPYISKYIKNRGKVFATKADFDDIKRQLTDTTRLAEQIKATVSHTEWTKREYKRLKRTTLEELLKNVYALDHWHAAELDSKVFMHPPHNLITTMKTINMLAGLYFPELTKQRFELFDTPHRMAMWLSDCLLETIGMNKVTFEYAQKIDPILDQRNEFYTALIKAISNFQLASQDIMPDV